MTDLIDHINTTTETCLGLGGKYYGLCRLLKDDKGAVYPVTYLDNIKVTPNDKYDLLVYHRLINSETEESEMHSFGRSSAVMNNQRIRTIVVVKFSEGETVIDDFINALPDKIVNLDYRFVELSKNISLIRDVQSIWETEWGNAYDDKYQMRFNLYALEYTLEYIKCSECV